MGYMRHDAVIVTASGWAVDGTARDVPVPDVEAFRQSLPEEWRPLVVGPVTSVVNGYQSFAFLPDGSNEGWEDSEKGDEYRERFAALFSFAFEDGSSPFSVLVIRARFGGDEPADGSEQEVIVSTRPPLPVREEPGL